MVILAIFEKKENKITNNDYRETDLIELKSYGEYSFGSHKEFFKIPSMTIAGKTILEWFSVDDFSYWWLIAPVINMRFNDSAYFIDNLISYIEKNSIHKIQLKTSFDKISFIKKICQEKQIELEFPRFQYFCYQTKHLIKNFVKKSAYKKITIQKNKKRLKLFKDTKKNFEPPSGSVIFTSHGLYLREGIDEKSEEIKKQEFFLQPFLDALYDNKKPFFCIDLDYTFRGETKNLSARLKSNYDWIPIEEITVKPKKESSVKIIHLLQKSIRNLNKHIDEGITYHGIPILHYLGNSFDEIFYEPYLPTFVHLVECAEDFFKKCSPKAIVQAYEHGSYAKAIEMAAKKLGIRTFAIQHGLISETIHDYIFYKCRDKDFPLGNPIPDITFVFGDYFKKILTEQGSYPKNKVLPIGNPTFYNLEKKKQFLKKQNIRKKYGISEETIILVPLSNLKLANSKDNYDFLLLTLLNENLKDNTNFKILVRGHPGSPFSENNLNELFPGNNFVLSKFSIFEDIYTSDIVVTPTSTVGIDATIFEKPVIFANMTEDPSILGEFQDYMISHKVAMICTKDDLISTIIHFQTKGFWDKVNPNEKKEFLHSFFNFDVEPDLMKLIFKE